MALVLADRVLETTPITGIGDANLSGAQANYQPFSVIGNGSTTYYTIVDSTNNSWEVGIGTYVLAGNKITRDTVLSSSNGGALVYFATGTKDIFLDLPSEKVLLTAGNVYGPASAVNSNFAAFDMTTGKLIKDSGYNASTFATAAQGAKADTAVQPGSLGTAAYLNVGAANGVASLDAGGKVPVSQIPALGDLNYQGTWNATTNVPTLLSSAGTKGYYYVVATAGTTNLNGITDWQIGDWAVFNGSVWQKIDNTDLVTSVNGYTGTVVLTYTDVGAQPAGTYVTSVGATSPVTSSGGTTPTIAMPAATTSVSGYLTSTDWTTFNNKGSGTVTAVTGSGNIASTGGTTPNITFTGVLPIANGGTNTTATPTLGGVTYGTGTAQAYTPTGSSGQFLTSSGGAAPTWTSATALAGAIGHYGSYIDTTTVTATSTTVNYVMSINTIDLQNGVSIVTGTKLTVANAGVYNLQFSAQLSNPNSAIADVSIFFRLNGVDVADGAGTVGIPAKHGSNNGLQIVSWNSFFNLSAGDYLEIVWHSNTTGVQLITIPATTDPVVPESPSLIVTIQALSQVGIGYYGQTSTTSTLIGTGSKTFTVGIPATSSAFTVGTRVRFAYTTTPSNFMEGVITAFATTSMTVNVDLTGGSGTYATWAVSVAGNQGTGAVTSVSGTAPVVSSGGTTPAISMAAATTSVNGYLTSTDWTTFNNKSNTNGTVTSVAALTLGTTGTDLSSTVATGTTTPVITLQVPTASATNRGALSSADWTTFNNKGSGTVTSVTGTAPVVSSGGATPAISMAAATTSVNGYLTSTDWTTFNNKAPAVTYTTTYIPFGQGTTTPALSANFTYTTGTGILAVPAIQASNGIILNSKAIGTTFSIPSADNAMSVGPVTIASGVTITLPSGSRWVVL
jgi:hypothetical protein